MCYGPYVVTEKEKNQAKKIKKKNLRRKPVSSGFVSAGASRECPRLCGGGICRNAITWL